jgi:hypothetical protein
MVVRFDTPLPHVDVPVPTDPNSSTAVNVGGIMVNIDASGTATSTGELASSTSSSSSSAPPTAPAPQNSSNLMVNRVSDIAPPRPSPLEIPTGRPSFVAPDAGPTPVAAWGASASLVSSSNIPSTQTVEPATTINA